MTKLILRLLKPKGYNTPINFPMLYNQWLHKGFIWKLYSYEYYSNNSKDVLPE